MNSSDRVKVALAALPIDRMAEKRPCGFIATVFTERQDAILIAAAPDLAAEVIRLREEVAKLKAIIADFDEEAK